MIINVKINLLQLKYLVKVKSLSYLMPKKEVKIVSIQRNLPNSPLLKGVRGMSYILMFYYNPLESPFSKEDLVEDYFAE